MPRRTADAPPFSASSSTDPPAKKRRGADKASSPSTSASSASSVSSSASAAAAPPRRRSSRRGGGSGGDGGGSGGQLAYCSSYSSSAYAGDLDGVAAVADAVHVPEMLIEVRRAGRRDGIGGCGVRLCDTVRAGAGGNVRVDSHHPNSHHATSSLPPFPHSSLPPFPFPLSNHRTHTHHITIPPPPPLYLRRRTTDAVPIRQQRPDARDLHTRDRKAVPGPFGGGEEECVAPLHLADVQETRPQNCSGGDAAIHHLPARRTARHPGRRRHGAHGSGRSGQTYQIP